MRCICPTGLVCPHPRQKLPEKPHMRLVSLQGPVEGTDRRRINQRNCSCQESGIQILHFESLVSKRSPQVLKRALNVRQSYLHRWRSTHLPQNSRMISCVYLLSTRYRAEETGNAVKSLFI